MSSSFEATMTVDFENAAGNSEGTRRRTAPTSVFVVYFVLVLLHGFVFSSVFWFVVPCFMKIMDISVEHAVAPAEVFLLFTHLAPIFGGLLSDTKCTRYRLIFVSQTLFMVAYGCAMIFERFMLRIAVENRVYPAGFLTVLVALCLGANYGALVTFGIEQLRDPSDRGTRISFILCFLFFNELGYCASYPLLAFEHHSGLITKLILIAACAVSTVLLVCWKRYYVFNSLEGYRTLKHVYEAFRTSCCGLEEEPDVEFSLVEPIPVSERVRSYRRCLLRRYVFLLLIFVTFGAYSDVNFMANMVYPIQARQMMLNQTETLDVFFSMTFDARGIAVILVMIPILDLLYRHSQFFRSRMDNFLRVGLGLSFAALSIGTATLSHYLYGQGGTRETLPNQDTQKQILLTTQYVFLGIGKLLFVSGGLDLAFVESPESLRGTFVGLFKGLGSVFGSCIFFLQYFMRPSGVNHKTWPYGMVFAILVVTIFVMYIPLVNIYRRRREEFRLIRQAIEDEQKLESPEYGTIPRDIRTLDHSIQSEQSGS